MVTKLSQEPSVEKKLSVKGKSKVLACLMLALAALPGAAFADGIADLGTEVTTALSGVSDSVLAVGIVIIGIAVVIGGVYLFKRLAGKL